MNVFYIYSDPIKAAKHMCDKHVVKMILESAELLTIAHYILDDNKITASVPLRKNHFNHPCSKWVRESNEHYLWLHRHACGLLDEYEDRYGRRHSYFYIICNTLNKVPSSIPVCDFSPPPQAMPDEYKDGDCVTAYRNYYRLGKRHLHQWRRNKPEWI